MKKLSYLLIVFPMLLFSQKPQLNLEEAKSLIQLPLSCIETEFPNKLSQTLVDSTELGTPKELHPIFYGCFDWHSSVHGYWTIVTLLKKFPELDPDNSIKNKLIQNFSKENIDREIDYFQKPHEYSYERTYGWAWLFKLQEALDSWDTPTGKEMSQNLQALTNVLLERNMEYLPKLNYPIRVGTHTNTAFGMSLAFDYAESIQHKEFQELIISRAKDFYLNDQNCPLTWEPSGYDFLSPCFQEIDLMRKVLKKEDFEIWVQTFLPEMQQKSFNIKVGEVSDRTDGHLVHLDGLNFSRAWIIYGLTQQYPSYDYLIPLADQHFHYSYPNLIGDSYEGGHWLASFALYALLEAE